MRYRVMTVYEGGYIKKWNERFNGKCTLTHKE